MQPHPNATELDGFDHGQLPRGRWSEIERHVAECDSCCEYLERVPDDALVSLLKSSSSCLDTPHSSFASPTTPTVEFRNVGPVQRRKEPPAELTNHPRYQVVEWLGAGGMGTVFKAEHRLMQRQVALKVIHADLLERPEVVERFRHEVRAAARLSHPNIAIAYDADQAGDVHFLVMEFAEGQSLDKILAARGALPWDEAYGFVVQAAEGLQHAFERGMVHRDLKPANLLVTADGQLKILDFGLARLVSETLLARPMTPVGAVVGTPHYLAPEQARDPHSADIRADIYSLGCTWYEMLTGKPPFPAAGLLQQLLSHQDQPVRPITDFRADVPPEMTAIVCRLLEKDPAKRFQTPAELLAALEPWVDSYVPAKPRRFGFRTWVAAACGLVAVVGLAIGGAFLMQWEDRPPVAVVPAKVDVEKVKALQLAAGEQAIAWLKVNNALGPGRDAKLIADNTQQLYGLPDDRAFVLRLQDKLVKSGRPTLLAGRRHDFFVFELPRGALAMPAFNAVLAMSRKQDHVFDPDPAIALSNLQFDQKTFDGDELSGSVSYEARRTVKGKLAIRLSLSASFDSKTAYKLLEQPSLSGKGTLTFRFVSLDEKLTPGRAAVMFVDVCEMDPDARQLIYSNNVAQAFVNPLTVEEKNP